MQELMDGWKTVALRSITPGTVPDIVITPTADQRVVLTCLYVGSSPSTTSPFSLTGSVSGDITSGLVRVPATTASTTVAGSTGVRLGANTVTTSASGSGQHGYTAFEKGETVTIGDLTDNTIHVDYQLQEEI